MRPYPAFAILFLIFVLAFANGCATTQPQPGDEAQKSDIAAQGATVPILEKISFSEGGNYTRIQMEGSAPMAAPFYKLLSNPNRIVIDIPNLDLKQIKEPLKIHNGTIGEVLATQYDDKGRIEIGLLERTAYNISKEDRILRVDIEKIKKVEEPKQELNKVEEPKAAPERVESVKEEKVEPPPVEPGKEGNGSAQAMASPVASPPQKAKEILEFSVDEKKDSMTFNIITDGRVENYNAFKMDSPARLVLDIWGVDTRYPKRSIRVRNPYVKEVRIGHHPDKLRLVFDASKSSLPPYHINRMDDRLMLSLGNGVPQAAEPQIALNVVTTAETKGASGSPEPSSSKVEGKASLTTAKSPKAAKENTVTGIDFKQMDHKSRVVITASEEPVFESQIISKNLIAVDVKSARALKHLLRPLDTKEFESTIGSIDIKNIKGRPSNDVRILIKLKEEVPYQVTKEGKVLYIDVDEPKKAETVSVTPAEKPAPETKPAEGVAPPAEEKPAPEPKAAETAPVTPEEKPAPLPSVAMKTEAGKKATEEIVSAKVYTGRRLSLDFKDADIKNILRLIAEVSNLNIITGEDVTGKITMRLVDVPWDQALDVILQTKSLGMARVGNVIRVAPVDKLKKEVEEELSAKRAKEKLEDLETELIPVNYASAKEVIPQVKSVLSERGDVRVDERTNILIIKDIPRNIAGVKNLVKSLDTKTPQVLIEARIVEATLTFQRELGVKWGLEVGGGTATLGGGIPGSTTLTQPVTPGQPTPRTSVPSATRNLVDLGALARSGVAGSSGTAGIIEFLFSRGTIRDLDIAISAHENQGDTKIISSPKIATLDNKEASIEQGLRIPYLKLTTEGTVTTDFIDANIKLTVTPHVTNDGHVKLSIKVKKDAPDQSIVVQGVPSIDKKEAITEVLVKDTGVVVIAGIYTIDKSMGQEGIPLFSKIPILGWLFKREAKQDNRRDLLIFISPKILKDQV